MSLSLKDVVYAPLEAVSHANRKLSGSIVEQIAAVSDFDSIDFNDPDAKLYLKNLQFIFDEINDEDGVTVKHQMGITTTLASVIPITALQVENARVGFNVEPRMSIAEDDILAKPAPPKPRESDKLPKIRYDITLKGYDMPEGMARIIDIMDVNQIPEIISSTYVDDEGKAYKNQEHFNRSKILKKYGSQFSKLLDSINELLGTLPLDANVKRYEEKHQEIQSIIVDIKTKLLDGSLNYAEEIYGEEIQRNIDV
jgi:hypothetical protein